MKTFRSYLHYKYATIEDGLWVLMCSKPKLIVENKNLKMEFSVKRKFVTLCELHLHNLCC